MIDFPQLAISDNYPENSAGADPVYGVNSAMCESAVTCAGSDLAADGQVFCRIWTLFSDPSSILTEHQQRKQGVGMKPYFVRKII